MPVANPHKIDLRIPDDIMSRLTEDARREGLSKSAVVRRILINHYTVISE